MQTAREVFDTLNADYLSVHKTKEDLFWATYMATSNDDSGFVRAEESYKNFISDPALLALVRDALDGLPPEKDEATRLLRQGLNGWRALIECNVIETDAARQLMRNLINRARRGADS